VHQEVVSLSGCYLKPPFVGSFLFCPGLWTIGLLCGSAALALAVWCSPVPKPVGCELCGAMLYSHGLLTLAMTSSSGSTTLLTMQFTLGPKS